VRELDQVFGAYFSSKAW